MDHKKYYILVLLCLLISLSAGEVYCDEGIRAVTKPCYDGKLTFSAPGRVAEVKSQVGQKVRAGDLLAKLDDRVESLRLEQLKAQSESLTRIKAAEARLEQNRSDLAKLQEAAKSGAASKREVEHAALEVKIGELSVELAKFEHDLDILKYKEMQEQVNRMKLFSPVDGIVEEVEIKIGEIVHTQEREKIIRVAKIDPLWIDVPVPKEKIGKLTLNAAAHVSFDDDQIVKGKISFIASLEDVATETVIVRIELPNPEKRRAGQKVIVLFPGTK